MIKRERAMAVTIVALLLLLSFIGWKYRGELANSESKGDYISSLNDTIRHLSNRVTEISAISVTKESFEEIVNNNKFLKKELTEAKIKIKNVKSMSGVVSDINLDKPIVVPFNADLSKLDTTLKMKLTFSSFKPITFGVDSQDYSIHGMIHKNYIQFDSISFRDSLSLITNIKKHLFARDEYNVTTRHSNKKVFTKGLMNITIKEEKPIWDRRAYFIIGGIVGGYFLFHK